MAFERFCNTIRIPSLQCFLASEDILCAFAVDGVRQKVESTIHNALSTVKAAHIPQGLQWHSGPHLALVIKGVTNLALSGLRSGLNGEPTNSQSYVSTNWVHPIQLGSQVAAPPTPRRPPGLRAYNSWARECAVVGNHYLGPAYDRRQRISVAKYGATCCNHCPCFPSSVSVLSPPVVVLVPTW